MGCDIKTYMEYRKPTNSGPIWTDCNEYKPNPYYNPNDEPSVPKSYKKYTIADSRNYNLFAVLANVRNYNGIKPLANPKGIPKDSCSEIIEGYESFKLDAHSASYYTLTELLNALPEYPILSNLVILLKETYDKVFPKNAPLITTNDIRIVFWFDN